MPNEKPKSRHNLRHISEQEHYSLFIRIQLTILVEDRQ